MLLVALGTGSVWAQINQDSLWGEIALAEAEGRYDDALALLRVVEPPQWELDASLEMGATLGWHSEEGPAGIYQESSVGSENSLELEWSLESGSTTHILSLGSDFDESYLATASGPNSESTELGDSYTLSPNVGYALLTQRFYVGATGEWLMIQNEDPSPGISVGASAVLLDLAPLRWTVNVSGSWSSVYADAVVLKSVLGWKRGSWSASLQGLGRLSLDTLSYPNETDTISNSYAGGEGTVRLGWKSRLWGLEASAGLGSFTCLQQDAWQEYSAGTAGAADTLGYTWYRSFQRQSLGFAFSRRLGSLDLLGNASWQRTTLPDITPGHPESYQTIAQSLGAALRLRWNFW